MEAKSPDFSDAVPFRPHLDDVSPVICPVENCGLRFSLEDKDEECDVPMMLVACGHSICSKCYTAVRAQSKPQCGIQGCCVEVTADGVPNLALAAYCDAMRNSSKTLDPPQLCKECADLDKVEAEATHECHTCGDRLLCEDHLVFHERKRHSLVRRGSGLSRRSRLRGGAVVAYCTTHDAAVRAGSDEHTAANGCTLLTERESRAHLEAKLRCAMAVCEAECGVKHNRSKEIEAAIVDLANVAATSAEKFCESVNACIAALLNHRDKLLKQMEVEFEAREKKLKAQVDGLMVDVGQLSSTVGMVKCVLADSDDESNLNALADAVDCTTRMQAMIHRPYNGLCVVPAVEIVSELETGFTSWFTPFASHASYIKSSNMDVSKCTVDGNGLVWFTGDKKSTPVENTIIITCKDRSGQDIVDIRSDIDDIQAYITRDVMSAGSVVNGGGGLGGAGGEGGEESKATDTVVVPVGHIVVHRPTVPLSSSSTQSLANGQVKVTYQVTDPTVDRVYIALRARGGALGQHHYEVWRRLFQDSEIVDKLPVEIGSTLERSLRGWLPQGNTVKGLLWSSVHNTKSADSFHRHCDGKGATLTLIRTSKGYTFGGYGSSSWSNRGTVIPCNAAFLFTVVNPQGNAPTRIPCRTQCGCGKNLRGCQHAMYGDRASGPVFGGGCYENVRLELDSWPSPSFALLSDSEGAFVDVLGQGKNTFTEKGTFVPEVVEVWLIG